MQNRTPFGKREGVALLFTPSSTALGYITRRFFLESTRRPSKIRLSISATMNKTILSPTSPTLVNRISHIVNFMAVLLLTAISARALDRTNITFKVFQFPPDKIPTIDGNTNDWNIVPDDYAIRMDQFVDDTGK